MLTFENATDSIIFSEMVHYGERTFNNGFWTNQGSLGMLIRRAMAMPHIKVVLRADPTSRITDPDNGNVGLIREWSFIWYSDADKGDTDERPLYEQSVKYWHHTEPNWQRVLVGGWVNHGTDLEPNWSSHT